MKIELRPYQEKLKNDIRDLFSKGSRSVILCAPTGSGKTVTFADICSETIKRGNKVAIVVDRKELLDQATNKLNEYGLFPEVITGGKKWINYDKSAFVCTIQTLKKRRFPKVDLLVIDEAHKQTFDGIAKHYRDAGSFVIGATATPIRKGKNAEQFGNIYSEIVKSVDIVDLISDGFLAPARTFGVVVEMDGVKQKNGDYDAGQMFDVYDKPFLYDGLFEKWHSTARDRKTIVFCINVKHSIATRNVFIQNGIRAEHVDGTTPKQERERILHDFKTGAIQVLCNVDILTTGYDEPSIGCVVVNRRTKSVPMWLQMTGRGSRIFRNKKDFIILDMGGNTTELGFWEQTREFSLWHKVNKNANGEAPTKECPPAKIDINDDGTFEEIEFSRLITPEDKKKYGCGKIVHSSASVCEHCGHVFPKSTLQMKEGDFLEIGEGFKEIPEHLQKPYSQMTIPELIEIQELKGFKRHWILHNLEKTDENLREFARIMGYKDSWIYYAKKNLFKSENRVSI